MSELLVFDIDDAIDRVDGDHDLYFEIYDMFLEDQAAQVQDIRLAAESKSALDLEHKAHAIKSALGNLGARRAHKCAYDLELAGKKDEFSNIQALINTFEQEVAAYIKECDQYRSKF